MVKNFKDLILTEDAKANLARIKTEISKEYFSDCNWKRCGIQLFLDLEIERESVFDQIPRIQRSLLFNCIKRMLRRGENYLQVHSGLVSFLTENHLQEQFKEIGSDPIVMVHYVNGSIQES